MDDQRSRVGAEFERAVERVVWRALLLPMLLGASVGFLVGHLVLWAERGFVVVGR